MSMYQDVPMENVEEVELVEGAIQGQEEEEEGQSHQHANKTSVMS